MAQDIERIIMSAVLDALAEKIATSVLKRADTKKIRHRLCHKLTNEMFYALLKNQKIGLYPGFGTVFIKEIKPKKKKVYDRKRGEMVEKMIRGKKVVFRPGDFIREFL